MSKPRAFVWGASGHAKIVVDAAAREGRSELVGYVDELRPERRGQALLGLPILGGSEQLEILRRDGVTHVALGVGDCEVRLRIAQRAEALGFQLLTVTHPAAVLALDVVLGAGTLVAAGAIVNPGSTLGRAVILNTACSVDHDCRVHDGAHLSPGVRLGGGVTIGAAAWVGIGSSVIQGVTIGAGAVVGAGSVVVRDVPESVVAFGVPARVRRSR